MGVLRKVAHFLNWAVTLLLGAAAVVWCAWALVSPAPVVVPIWELSVRTSVVFILAGALLVTLNTVLIWDFLSNAFGLKYLKLDGGRVSVSVKALQDALERAVKGIPEVSAARVSVSPPARRGRPVLIKAYVSLRGSIVYHSISSSVMSVLENTFSDIVSEGSPVRCQVYWEKIRQDNTAAPSGTGYAEGLRPRFPVEVEEEQDQQQH